jgi:hypothetical protein
MATGRAELAHPLDDEIVRGVTGKGLSPMSHSCAPLGARSSA